jgi:DNA-directed RNA polymerase subunit M/transcription elongation factor TFIIS
MAVSYFCCKCQQLIALDRRVDPQTFVCDQCEKEQEENVKSSAGSVLTV